MPGFFQLSYTRLATGQRGARSNERPVRTPHGRGQRVIDSERHCAELLCELSKWDEEEAGVRYGMRMRD